MRNVRSLESGRRAGFTLVELLTVIVIILVVAALIVGLAPNLGQREKVPKGTSLFQQWLLTAKRQAVHDRAPRGLRIQPIPIIIRSGTAVLLTGSPTTINVQTSGVTSPQTANPTGNPNN